MMSKWKLAKQSAVSARVHRGQDAMRFPPGNEFPGSFPEVG
jgi:hypothetical protein